MLYLFIYGTITIAAISFYIFILERRANSILVRQLKRDVLHAELASNINNSVITIQENNKDFEMKRLNLYNQVKVSKFLLGIRKYAGKDLYFFVDQWLSSLSLKKNFKYQIGCNEDFLMTKFKAKDCKLFLDCFQILLSPNWSQVDFRIKLTNKKIDIYCSSFLDDYITELNKLFVENWAKEKRIKIKFELGESKSLIVSLSL